MPTLEMRAFPSQKKDEGLKWASKLPAEQRAKEPALRIIPTDRDNVLGFEINGMITAEELPAVIDRVNTFLVSHDKVRMLARVKNLGGFDPDIFMHRRLFSMKITAMLKVERYAIVGAPGWMNKALQTITPIFPQLDMRTFTADKEADAWAWLEAYPA